MFQTLPGHWLPAAFSKSLKRQPLRIDLAGESLVLFRNEAGKACALLDRCPHRGVSLSLGKVTQEGCLECPFHGWRFNGQGGCEFIPWNPEVDRDRMSTSGFATHEQAGLIWIYTSEHQPNPATPDIPDMLLSKATLHYLEVVWKCHWTRAMENMLDVPHLPFIHQKTIGRLVPDPRNRANVSISFDIDKRDYGFRLKSLYDGKAGAGWIEWRKPVNMVLNISEKPWPHRQHIFCVPGAQNETRMILVSAYGGPKLLTPLFSMMSWSNHLIMNEDQRVIESSSPAEIPLEGQEKSVPTDKPTLIFRNWYKEQKQNAQG